MSPPHIAATLVSIQVGEPTEHDQGTQAGAWTSGILKRPVNGEVFVGSEQIEGDGQADNVHHGGIDKAVLCYSADHYPHWREEPELTTIDFGGFGENFSVSGIDEESTCIGDRWQLGSVEVEVSQPRQPCWKLSRRWDMKKLPPLVISSGRTGWYCRVTRTGYVAMGAVMTLLQRPQPNWSVARANQVMYGRAAAEKRRLADLPELSESWRLALRK